MVRTNYHKYFHPKECLISNGVLNRAISESAGKTVAFMAGEEGNNTQVQLQTKLQTTYSKANILKWIFYLGFCFDIFQIQNEIKRLITIKSKWNKIKLKLTSGPEKKELMEHLFIGLISVHIL